MSDVPGTLYLVSTPIGNLEDLSPRARRVLSLVSYVLCESPSQSRKLGLSVSLLPYQRRGFKAKLQQEKVLADLRSGRSVALVTNAGTPLVSDPGLSLVRTVVESQLPIVHIPGPVAFVSAMVTSGLPTKNILFIGYLPKKSAAIEKKLTLAKKSLAVLAEPVSLVCYVSKYQLERTLLAVDKILGSKIMISLARELTKLHEEHRTGTLTEIRDWLQQSQQRARGEFTLILNIPLK